MTNFNRIFLFSIFIGIFLGISPFVWAITSVTVYPETPRQGDIISIHVTGSPLEESDISVSFRDTLPVMKGSFNWSNMVKIPISPNIVSVYAEGVNYISVSIDLDELTVTMTGTGVNGTATINYIDVSPGIYTVEVNGNSLANNENVSLVFNISSTVRLDNLGKYETQIDSSYLPIGMFNASVGTIKTSVTIADALPNTAPSASFIIPSKSSKSKTIQLDASKSFDEDGIITDFVWDINGSIYLGESIFWTPETNGYYDITLTVIDDDGAEDIISKSIIVEAKDTWIRAVLLILAIGVIIMAVKKNR